MLYEVITPECRKNFLLGFDVDVDLSGYAVGDPRRIRLAVDRIDNFRREFLA